MYPREIIHQFTEFIFSDDPIARFCVIGIVTLAIVYVLQNMLLGALKYDMKKFGRDVYRNTKKAYMSIAWLGWLFIFLGIATIEAMALNASLIEGINFEFGIMVGVVLIIVGLLINFRNFIRVYFRALREKLH